ncbi:MAG TPA: hypothetical protein VI844_00835 [Coxiellaceae bacterium]|nr:hypothetical protein [Coxiellaceae bacterium]
MPRVTGVTGNAIMDRLFSMRPSAQATYLLKKALAESLDNVTATALVTTPAETTSSSSQALKALDEFQKDNRDVLKKSAEKLDQERDALETRRKNLVKKYDAQLTQLTEAIKLIQADIAKLTPPVAGEAAHEKELREKKVESLKATLTSIKETETKLATWKNWANGNAIKTGEFENPGIVVPNNPAKTQGIEQRLATAAYKLETLAPRPRAIDNPILNELNAQTITDCFTLNLAGNQTAQQFSKTIAELQAPLLKLKILEAKMINPETSTLYRDDYIATLKQISTINERIAQQLKDDNARQLIVNAANAAGKLNDFSMLMRNVFILQGQIDKQIYSGDRKVRILDLDKDIISAQKLGKNLCFSWTEKIIDPTTGKPIVDPTTGKPTGETKEVSLTDDKGNQIHFSLAEVKEMVAAKNKQEFDTWQKGGKIGPAPKPIEVKEDWFGSGYTIRCHDAERRADFIKNTMKPTWDAKLKANQTKTQTATQSNVSVPVSVTEADGTVAFPPKTKRDTELTMNAITAAYNSSQFGQVKSLIENNPNNLDLDACQQLLSGPDNKRWPAPTNQSATGYADAYQALQTAVTSLAQQQASQRNLRVAAAEKRNPAPDSLAAQV